MDMALHTHSTELDLDAQQRMVPVLLRWLAARHGEPVAQVETHLSQVLLAGGLVTLLLTLISAELALLIWLHLDRGWPLTQAALVVAAINLLLTEIGRAHV